SLAPPTPPASATTCRFFINDQISSNEFTTSIQFGKRNALRLTSYVLQNYRHATLLASGARSLTLSSAGYPIVMSACGCQAAGNCNTRHTNSGTNSGAHIQQAPRP